MHDKTPKMAAALRAACAQGSAQCSEFFYMSNSWFCTFHGPCIRSPGWPAYFERPAGAHYTLSTCRFSVLTAGHVSATFKDVDGAGSFNRGSTYWHSDDPGPLNVYAAEADQFDFNGYEGASASGRSASPLGRNPQRNRFLRSRRRPRARLRPHPLRRRPRRRPRRLPRLRGPLSTSCDLSRTRWCGSTTSCTTAARRAAFETRPLPGRRRGGCSAGREPSARR